MQPELSWVTNSYSDLFLVDSDWQIYATIIKSDKLATRPNELRSMPTGEYTLTYIEEDGSIFEGKFYSTSQRDRAIKIAEENAKTPTNQLFYHKIA